MIEDEIKHKLTILYINISNYRNAIDILQFRAPELNTMLENGNELLKRKIIDEETYLKIINYVEEDLKNRKAQINFKREGDD